MRTILFAAIAFLGLTAPAPAQTNQQDVVKVVTAGFDHVRRGVDSDLVIDAQTAKDFEGSDVDVASLLATLKREIFIPVEELSRTRECRTARMRVHSGKSYFRFEPPTFTDTGARLRVHVTSAIARPRAYIITRSITLELIRTEKGFDVLREIEKEASAKVISECGR